MPVENERKFILLESPLIERIISENAERMILVEQKYLATEKGLSVRIRSLTEGTATIYRMTVKQDVGGKVIEIETTISEDDFRRLWPVATGKIIKTRYLYQGWEIDYFKSKDGNNYLAVAEFEMPENQKEPNSIPNLINNYLIYTVPIGDKRFSNKRLSDIKYTNELLAEVKKRSNARIVEQVNDKVLNKKFR